MAMTLSGGGGGGVGGVGGGGGGGGGLGLVLVEFEYEYTGRDGSLVSIKPHERYMLLAKTNDHWWHVRRDLRSRPFYIPAKYVKELPNAFPSPLDFTPPSPPPVGVAGSGPPGAVVSVVSPSPPSPEPKMAPSAAQDLAQEKRAGDEVTIRVKSPNRYRKTENRMSTFGVPLDMMHVDPPVAQAAAFKRAQTEPAFSIAALAGGGGGGGGGSGTQEHAPSSSSSSSSSSQKKRLSFFGGGSRGSNAAPAPAPPAVILPVVPAIEDLSHKPRVPSFSPADPVHRPIQGKPVDLPIIKALGSEVPLREEESPEPVSPLEPDSESVSSTEPDRSPDSENIYESILDLNLNLDGSPVSETAPALIPAPALPESGSTHHTCLPVPPAVPPHGKPENENPTTAVYANVTDVKRATPRAPTTNNTTSSASSASSPTSSSTQRPLSGGEGWEVHTDKDSGKAFYYQPSTGQSKWEDPRSPTAVAAAAGASMDSLASPLSTSSLTSPCASTSSSRGSDWEQLLDETTGRYYYHNPSSGQTSWAAPDLTSPASPLSPSTPPAAESHILQRQHSDGPPPLPEEDYPTEEQPETPVFTRDVPFAPVKRVPVPIPTLEPSAPAGWTRSQQQDGKTLFTSERTQEQWLQSKDQKGRTYYYLKNGSKSQWNLPELSAAPSSQPAVGNGVDSEGAPVLKNWRHSMAPSTTHLPAPADDTRFFPAHRRHVSDNTSDASSSGNSPETPHHDGRVRLRRNLSNTSTDSQVYHGHLLEKAGILNKTKVVDSGKKIRKNWSQSWTVLHGGILTFHKDPKSAPSGPSSKSNQIVPEFTVELRGASVMWAAKDKSSKKNVLELKTRNGSEYLIQYDTDSIITDWHKIIVDTIKQLDQDHFSEEDEDDENDKDRKRSLRSGQSGDGDQGRVRTKLRKFLQRRPTLQAVKEKGYIKDAVFGCHLDTLCHRENTTVPRFVEKCIKAVERRGLDVDGIYRVSGNLAVIQRLRHRADHDDNLDLEDGQWEEIHVITGALKLFLREMPEPLFPFSFFDKFIAAIQISDYAQKVSYMQDLVRSLPLPNHNTMEVLFKHLRRVIECGEANRMSVQSTAIVFGPTLLRPQTESANITIHMVFQNQIVELILNEFEEVFKPR
ncbi:rho GTPase-activating protein 27 isoform X2 [Engraulis encrasicolus]|uniref:rho GTPase-activating protein 27 isoform X2 n=1 Tax=Engraulis encrasicolus TaxID=184585 RepID=UPI002FD1B373